MMHRWGSEYLGRGMWLAELVATAALALSAFFRVDETSGDEGWNGKCWRLGETAGSAEGSNIYNRTKLRPHRTC